MNKLYVQYGCGLSAPKDWINFDVSPTLRIQKIPIIGYLFKPILKIDWPKNVKYGDIVAGLPIKDDSCDALYCSHTLEHLSLNDFRKALRNSYKILKKGGIFRCVVPDLEIAARTYIKELENGKSSASLSFMGENTLLGYTERLRGFNGAINYFLGNHQHLWMWDFQSLSQELKNTGFLKVRKCEFNDSEDLMFKLVEDRSRFTNSLAIECFK